MFNPNFDDIHEVFTVCTECEKHTDHKYMVIAKIENEIEVRVYFYRCKECGNEFSGDGEISF